jgi:tRNA/tmRNA/rRNA uracil-C5-methylase (TrmA/RlmC/RlmD family)
VTFADQVRQVAVGRRLVLPGTADPEPLAALDYADEQALKQEALATFWKEHRLPGAPSPLVPAPQPRGYRTTTKRRVVQRRGGLALSFAGAPAGDAAVAPSVLDPPDHLALYSAAAAALARPSGKALAAALNYVIVRGTAPALAVIFNVNVFDAAVVRGAKQAAEAVQTAGARAAFLYLDPTSSDYYLEARRPAGKLSFKRLFGPEWMEAAVDGIRLRFPPTVFSQVNGVMLPAMVDAVRGLLEPLAGRHLLDLYCGYGLFSLTVGRAAARVTGVDSDGPAIEAASGNARHLRADARFIAGRVTGEFLEGLRAPREAEAVLLDPPRQGTEPGVAAAVAARQPERVVHICCGVDEIPREIAAWSQAGYTLQRALPLDLFAGTTGLETLMLLVPAP